MESKTSANGLKRAKPIDMLFVSAGQKINKNLSVIAHVAGLLSYLVFLLGLVFKPWMPAPAVKLSVIT